MEIHNLSVFQPFLISFFITQGYISFRAVYQLIVFQTMDPANQKVVGEDTNNGIRKRITLIK